MWSFWKEVGHIHILLPNNYTSGNLTRIGKFILLKTKSEFFYVIKNGKQDSVPVERELKLRRVYVCLCMCVFTTIEMLSYRDHA